MSVLVSGYWNIGILGYRDIGISGYWDIGILEYRDIGISGYWDIGILEYWDIGMLGYWDGILGYWDIGISGKYLLASRIAGDEAMGLEELHSFVKARGHLGVTQGPVTRKLPP